ncbi:DUF2199 domain-containing protein [Myroides sp. 1354]|uniref:DUF2199 domain-containing protein n=1 Tax=unclassified Myroides TaxID=2642485 RepID=UPI002576D82C|nr:MULTISPECIES: DUF2199 domain-containing protein [unclassified Myroides]MDM1046193.1 DUF2199 domain-containing protein [Myroides sp. R163-1]MDM1057091.1 DUF2199 domain-containing protein [Myroides sp. 1354]MDM1070324.1 DUF2199 domain-containing protein [Myroides sp. 1372]
MKYICVDCGQEHEDWPALAYPTPLSYAQLTEEEKKEAEVTSDFCVIIHPEHTYYFIRVVLIQTVVDACQDLDYGVWVSLSEKSFKEYYENFENKAFKTTYFGWLNNHIGPYSFDTCMEIGTNVEVDNEKGRPYIYLHQKENNELIRDFYSGITTEEATKRIQVALGN